MDTFIKDLIAMAPNNKKLVRSLVSMRENYVSSLPFGFRIVKKCSMRKILNLIPEDSIFSPSDKNLGACLLPPAWYEKEYASQIRNSGFR